jgi:hypothetical protein
VPGGVPGENFLYHYYIGASQVVAVDIGLAGGSFRRAERSYFCALSFQFSVASFQLMRKELARASSSVENL